VLKSSFSPTEPIAVKVEFARNHKPVPIEFVWKDPSGNVFFAGEPYEIAEGNTGVSSVLERSEGRPSGKWTVEAVCSGKVVGSTTFNIR